MFFEAVSQRNPALFEAAASLHQSGKIGPDTWVVDRDAVVRNAEILAERCSDYDITAWFITKQLGRCPDLIEAISQHLPLATAVDYREALAVKRAGGKLANIGHLVQIPRRLLPKLIDANYVTVFDRANLRAVAKAALASGNEVPVLLKLTGPEVYPGQEGGFELDDVPRLVAEIAEEDGIRLAGVTGFPCVLFDADVGRPKLTEIARRVTRAADILRKQGIDPVVSMPSHSSWSTIPLIAEAGGNVIEPGHALTGTTPEHAHNLALPEIPAMVYVSEIVQCEPVPAVAGGGFYPRGHAKHVLIRDGKSRELKTELEPSTPGHIDYYRRIARPDGQEISLGATALMAFRTQLFTTRSHLAVVSSVGGRARLDGVYDSYGHVISGDQL